MAEVSPVLKQTPYSSAKGYHGFPMDHVLNWTSAIGFLVPLYYDRLNPGDKVKIKTYWRTTTKELTSPAMVDITERIEWFAVPLHQLYKLFGSKFYGIQDFESDFYQANVSNNPIGDQLPLIYLSDIDSFLSQTPLYLTSPQEQYQYLVADNLVDNPCYGDACRLMSHLGIPRTLLNHANWGSDNPITGSIHPFFFAAYQKIWYDVYRDSDRIINYPQAYNFDSITALLNNTNNVVPTGRFGKLFKLHRRPYLKDYFTSQLVSPVVGSADTGMLGSDLTKINQWLTSQEFGTIGSDRNAQGIGTASINPYTSTQSFDTSEPTTVSQKFGVSRLTGANSPIVAPLQAINPVNIRSLYAVEKLLEVTRRAKKHYDMQTLAHFGVKVPQGISGEVIRIGVEKQHIDVNRVVSSASTSEGALGELAGYGLSSSKEKDYLTFEADCHCILMGIYSAEPLIAYPDTGLDKNLTCVNASDWYKPEFDDLGMQPLFGYEVAFDNTYNSSVLGWQSRYAEQKVKYSKSITGMSTTYFNEWVINRDPAYLLALSTMPVTSVTPASWFYVSPNDMDQILLHPFNPEASSHGNPDEPFASDYLVCQAYFDVTKSSKMSIHGTPNL